MFRITAPSEEGRREPLLALDPGGAGAPVPLAEVLVAPAEAGAHGWMGPGLRRGDRSEQPWWGGLRGPIGSFGLHMVILLLLIDWQIAPPAEIAPVTVHLVVEPPPPPEPKPAPQPVSKPPPPPHQGRLASDDFGDTEAKEKGAAAVSAKPETPTEADPSETSQKMAAVVPPPPEKPSPPQDEPAPKPLPKPNPTAHQPPKRPEEPARIAPRRARFPGPSATRDEYLAYLLTLTRQHLNLLPMAALADRRGVTVIDLLVLDDGTIAMLRVGQSSGYPDIDRKVEQVIAAIGRFPPLPQWIQGPSMRLEFRLRFPEALQE